MDVFTLNDLKGTPNEPNNGDVISTIKEEQPVANESGVVEVSIDEIRPYKEPEFVGQKTLDKEFGALDAALEREHEKIERVQQEYLDKYYDEQLDKDDEDDNNSQADPQTLTVEKNDFEDDEDTDATPVANIFDSDDEDFFKDLDDDDDDDEKENDVNQDEQIENIKASIKEKLIPIKNKIDLGKFSINNKPISISKLLNSTTEDTHVADWMLYSTKTPISVSEFSGPEIEKMNPGNSNRNTLNTYKDIYSIIYKHIVDANKPATMEAWVKTLQFFDLDHLYFAIYKACFGSMNTIPYACPECGETFMADIDIEDMVKYSSDEVKDEVAKILQKESTSSGEGNPVELVQVSDDYVIGLKDPSVYEVVFEVSSLDREFSTKYQDLLAIMSYIDTIYFIDRSTNQLSPIAIKQYPNDIAKTTKRKIKIYYEILSTLSSDQYFAFTSYIKQINDRNEVIQYRLPETTCPKCNHLIPEEIRKPDSLLFTRHQLGAIVNI